MKLWNDYKRYWKQRRWLMISMHLMLASLLFTNVMVGSKPILCKYKGHWHAMMLFSKPEDGSEFLSDLQSEAQYDYRKLNYDFVIWPLIHLDPKEMDAESAWLKPFSKNQKDKRYLLGSYDLGRDVLAGCIYGLHKSLLLSLLTILLSGIPGILIGSVFCFQAQRFSRISILSIAFLMLFLGVLSYFIVLLFEWKHLDGFLVPIMILMLLSCVVLAAIFMNRTPQRSFKLDFFGLKYIEFMNSIPVIILLLVLLQVVKNPDVFGLAFLISLVYIPVIAKYARAFTLSASNETYIDSIVAIGQNGYMIYWKHIFPKLISDLVPILAFGVANIILLEATLSFLGLGLSIDEVSLGTMMFAARSYPSAWWVIILPGLLVFWMVATFNSFGEIVSGRKWIRDYKA